VITESANNRFTDSPAVNPRQRAVLIATIVLLYVVLIVGLVRGLGGVAAGDAGEEPVPALIAYAISAEPAPPAPSPEPAGAQAEVGKKAKPKEIITARARIPNKAVAAASAASNGTDTRSGAGAAGSGTGGGGVGVGTGSGGSGTGTGSGSAARAIKIAGEITSVRDYPAKGRAERQGKQVIVVLRVGTDGQSKSCRVHKPSGVDAADAVTCALAMKRFRFRPALDRSGAPVESDYGWEQHWNAP
jgi:periplasmic protein TonB